MKQVIKAATLLMSLYMLIILTACGRIWVAGGGDVWEFLDVAELASVSTDIVRVEVLDSREEWIITLLPPFPPDINLSDEYELCTVHRLRVIEVFKGSEESGAIMEVMQLGGLSNRRSFMSDSFVDFAIGDDLILFMESFGYERPAVLLTPHQSVYRVITSVDGSLNIENFCESNDFILTMEELKRIADEYFGRYP